MPQARRVLIVTDNTTTGRSNRAVLERLSKEGRCGAEFVFLDSGEGLLLDELLAKLKAAPGQSIVYYADFFQDRAGNALNLETVMPKVAASAPGPVFVHGAIYLGYGAMGGKLNSGFHQGKTAGLLARRIWEGQKPEAIPVIRENVNRYMFAWQALQRWRIPVSKLPEGSEVLNWDILYPPCQELFLNVFISTG